MISIELHAARRDELQTIENLMQFYTYDFSEWLPRPLGEPAMDLLLVAGDHLLGAPLGRRAVGVA